MAVRQKLILACELGVFALFASYIWFQGPPVNPRNFARIERGMTDREVEGILGPASPAWLDESPLAKQYSGEGYSIVIIYDESGAVLSKRDYNWIYRFHWEQPLRYRIRWWLASNVLAPCRSLIMHEATK
jgi:hypothetical protein